MFTFSPTDKVISYLPPRTPPSPIYPYLLCNIGSGVSMLKVSAPNTFERIGGSSLGGGTLWGLLSLLTPATGFDEMLALSETGDNTEVDMLVGDIYGSDYLKMGLKSSTIASTFGKVARKAKERGAEHGPLKGFNPQDISRSLLFAISNNIGQITYLQAQLHDLQHIYFGGSFIRGSLPSHKLSCLYSRPYNNYEYTKLCDKVLEQRHEAGLLPPPRRLSRLHRSISATSTK